MVNMGPVVTIVHVVLWENVLPSEFGFFNKVWIQKDCRLHCVYLSGMAQPKTGMKWESKESNDELAVSPNR